MKTPFDTLLQHRAEAISRAHCPYTPDQLDGFIARAIASEPVAVQETWLPSPQRAYPSRVRLYSFAACLVLACFVTSYLFAPAAVYPPMRTVALGGCAETYGQISTMLSQMSNTAAI